MMQLLDGIRYLQARRVPITAFGPRTVLVEVASDRRVDLAIVTPEQYRAFQAARTGDTLGFDFVDAVRAYEFVVEVVPGSPPPSLLIWNSNETADAFVAYKMSDVTAGGGVEARPADRPVAAMAGR